ncbi:cytochrome c oxidase assembly protein [SAR86 cluster bacterium]|nr:cytochrome c oxidase assembly protein [SAR86 cluster bacterium]
MNSTKRSASKLVLMTCGMFCFGFALVPIYDVFCDITGLNGKISGPTFTSYDQAIEIREVQITFVTSNNNKMPWSFKSASPQMRVKTGEDYLMNFTFKNTTDKPMIAQAIPSVSPGRGARYFHKTECFCFEQQFLEAGESITVPVKFIIDPELPKNIASLALGYTLFDVTEEFANLQALN